MVKISFALFNRHADFSRLADEVKMAVAGGVDFIHVEVMDGHFVPTIWGGAGMVKALRDKTTLPLIVHLAIENPENHIEQIAEAGSDIIVIHAEACRHLHHTIQRIKELGKNAGVALNPETPLCMIENVLEEVDHVLMMCVSPGFYGQTFVPYVLPKIERCRKMVKEHGLDTDIEVDGGINEKTAPLAVKAGASIFELGHVLYPSGNTKRVVEAFRKLSSSRPFASNND